MISITEHYKTEVKYFMSILYFKNGLSSLIKNTFKQFYQYGYWKVFVNKKHAAITTLRQLIPTLFTLYLFLIPVFYHMDHILLLCAPLARHVLLIFYYTAF